MSKFPHSRFFESESDFAGSFVVIRDVGPWDAHPTLTNDAEKVCADLVEEARVAPDGRIFYYDSEGEPGELVHERGRFVRFAPWDGRTR